jgi:trehalose 6-phosphate phosphatase
MAEHASGAIGSAALPPPPPLRVAQSALFADLDGTLAPIEATPDAVRPDAGRNRLLDALTRALGGRLAIVSGRGLADLDRVLQGRVAAVAAVHGLVRRGANGAVVCAGDRDRVAEASAALRAFVRSHPALLVEDKGVAAALHYRADPSAAGASRAEADRVAENLGLVVQPGDMVVELRSPGPDKGAAVRAFMGEAPFAGFTPIFVGDDLTDEAGFEAARALGGWGVVVGARRPTAALYTLADVAATQAWLWSAAEA